MVCSRATFAEYINRSVEKGKRNGRNYTAADIAKDTDGVAWQLAIYKFVPSLFDIDGALADMQQESGISDVIARNQGAESGAVVGADPVAVGAEQYDLKEALTTLGDYDADRRRHIEFNPNDKISRNYDEIAEFINTASKQNPVKRLHIGVVNPDVADLAKKKANVDITDYDFVIASNFIAHIFDEHGNEKTEAARGQKAVDKSNIEDIIETVIQPDDVSSTTDNQGNKALKFEKDINGRNVAITITSTKKGTLTLKSAWIINKNSGGRTPPASANTLAGTSKTSGRSSTDNSIHQNEPVVNPEAKENVSESKIDEKSENSRSVAVSVEGEQTGVNPSSVANATASPRGEASMETSRDSGNIEGATEGPSGTPVPTGEFNGQGEVIDGATSSSTVSDGPPSPLEKADLDRAKRDAERIIEWERKEAPTVEELNRVRGAVKNFDSLSGDRQRAIVRMVRSGKNIDEGVIRGVSNIMAITNKKGAVLAPDVEIRFAEFGKDSTRRGIKTEVGGKTVIVLNANATYKDTIRGTIAHEIVHYLENRKGYKALADFAMKHAKAEKVAQVRETYKGVYDGENAEAKIEGEVVASVVAEMFGSEKFLKRYAQMGEEQSSVVKKIARFVKGIANSLKEKDEEAGAIARQMMDLFDKALGSEVSGEKTGTKYSYAGEKAETADKMSLARAKHMLADGVDSETIRKETGWFKGYDGKWRFELDDFDSSLIEHPKLERHEDDGEVYFTGKLTDIFNHNTLFKAYPQLKNINIVIQKTEFGVDAIYQPNSNYITLSIEQFKRYTKEYHDFLNGGRKAEIEAIEQTPEYKGYNRFFEDDAMDNMDPTEWLEAEIKARDKFFSSDIGKRYHELRWGKNNFKGEKFELGWDKGAKEVLLHELQHAVQKIEGFASGTNTRDKNYDRNAGEIEAFDTGRRASLTAEERKNTRPDIDREDVVFSDEIVVSYFAKNEYDEEIANIKPQLRHAQEKLNAMEVVFKGSIKRKFDRKEDMKKWAISELRQYGYKADRQGLGEILFPERAIDDAIGHIKDQDEILPIIALFRVLKRGIQIAEHGNHKTRGKHTITIAAPIEINGVRGNMGVVVNLRNNKYYVHRVIMPDGSSFKFDIKKDTNQEMRKGVPNGSLADATRSVSNNSIHQNEPVVNTSDKKSSNNEQYDLDPEAVNREAGCYLNGFAILKLSYGGFIF